jgi:hypothetical protein
MQIRQKTWPLKILIGLNYVKDCQSILEEVSADRTKK